MQKAKKKGVHNSENKNQQFDELSEREKTGHITWQDGRPSSQGNNMSKNIHAF